MKQTTTQNETKFTPNLTIHDLERLTMLLDATDTLLVEGLAAEAAQIVEEATERLRKPITYQQHECTIRAVG